VDARPAVKEKGHQGGRRPHGKKKLEEVGATVESVILRLEKSD